MTIRPMCNCGVLCFSRNCSSSNAFTPSIEVSGIAYSTIPELTNHDLFSFRPNGFDESMSNWGELASGSPWNVPDIAGLSSIASSSGYSNFDVRLQFLQFQQGDNCYIQCDLSFLYNYVPNIFTVVSGNLKFGAFGFDFGSAIGSSYQIGTIRCGDGVQTYTIPLDSLMESPQLPSEFSFRKTSSITGNTLATFSSETKLRYIPIGAGSNDFAFDIADFSNATATIRFTPS